jgi:hypothetical protein
VENEPQPPKPSKLVGYLALLLSIGGSGCLFLGPYGALAGVALGTLAIGLELRAPERHAGGGAAMAAILIGAAGAWYFYSNRPYISSRGELRSGFPSEAGAIGQLRSIASAEAAFDSAAGLGYADLACLREPRKCAPHLPENTPPFVDEAVLSKTGAYVMTFHPGAKSTDTGFQSYAVVAVPRIPGETGKRAYCVDSTMTIRVANDGSPPPVANGLCATSTPVLR